MKRINFRSFVYSSLVLMAAILTCLLTLNIVPLGIILLVVIIVAPVIAAVILKNKIKKYQFVTVIMTACLCVVSTVCFFVKAFTWLPDEYNGGRAEVIATIDDVIGDSNKVILKNLTIGGERMSGRLQLTIMGSGASDDFTDRLERGDTVRFTALVEVRKLVNGFSINASYLRSNIRFLARTSVASIGVTKGNGDRSVSGYIKSLLYKNMGEKYGAIAFGMLTGDKNEISSSVMDDFSSSGIVHVLAVSGLHIGVLAGIIAFVMRRLKAKRLPTYIVTLVVLVLYAALAGFSPSVLRACLMFVVGGGATLLGEERDSLNSLGAASTAVLAVSPMMLFEVGFIMSVGAVFGIINFGPIVSRLLVKIKCPLKIASAISITVGAQLGILPPLMCFFGYIQTYSILINILMIPFMSLAFIVVFVALLLSLIPIFGFFLKGAAVLVRGMTVGASIGAMLPYAEIAVQKSYFAFALYPLYFLAGDFYNCKHKIAFKGTCYGLMLFIVFLLAVV